jgi:hypothetical protein
MSQAARLAKTRPSIYESASPTTTGETITPLENAHGPAATDGEDWWVGNEVASDLGAETDTAAFNLVGVRGFSEATGFGAFVSMTHGDVMPCR